ncbi:MAG: site-specific DNA-methyltransferase [Chloroflexi bacterium]|nr:site-specific DNA-methyltransferase [Chloroflexota bacterium]
MGQARLHWEGKRSPRPVAIPPARHIETYRPAQSTIQKHKPKTWAGWPATAYPAGGLLFHGDNKAALAHLLSGGFRGKVNLVYADPPFASGFEYTRKIELRKGRGGAGVVGKQVQYNDTWDDDTYLQFMYERLLLLHELLAGEGSIYLHCDWRQSHHLRCLMDEVFGAENLRNEIIWFYPRGGDGERQFNRKHDTILFYTKGDTWTFNYHDVLIPYTQKQLDRFDHEDEHGRFYWNVNPRGERVKTYLRKKGIGEYDVWNIGINAAQIRRVGYPTMKPEALLERIIRASSNPGDIVLDCFAGSGTTAVVAQKLGRRWIAGDVNRRAIQIAAKRLYAVAREPFTVWRVGNGDDEPREPPTAKVSVERLASANGHGPVVRITLDEYANPAIGAWLKQRSGENSLDLSDGRCMIDSVMIDPAYDGHTFRVALADMPAKQHEAVRGVYELPAAGEVGTVAVKIVDVLGGEVIVTARPEV